MSDELQPARDKEPEATRTRWTGRKRDPERFRVRILAHLRGQCRFRSRPLDPTNRQIAWEAWHILKHYWARETFCYECACIIPAHLFPAALEKEAKYDD